MVGYVRAINGRTTQFLTQFGNFKFADQSMIQAEFRIYADSGSGWSQGSRYSRRRRRFASSSPVTS